MPSKQANEVKALYEGWTAANRTDPPMTLAERRDMVERWEAVTVEPGGIDYIEVDAGSVPAMWAVPKGCAEDRVILCLHGGGYFAGSIYTHRKVFGHIAKAIGCRALMLNYRLSPEHVFPAALEDTVAAYRWLLDQGIKPEHIALTGDSAGGGLSITALLSARQQGLPLPAASMPLSPWFDMEVTGGTMASNHENDAFFHKQVVEGLVSLFLGEGGDRRDPLANPLYADLTGLPPIYIQVGGAETLLDDARRLGERARTAGVDVRLDVFPELQHTFHFAAGRAPEADDAIRRLADWVIPKLGLAVTVRTAEMADA